MSGSATYDLLRDIGPVTRRQIVRHFRADSCIASTRIGLTLCEAMLHLESYPLSVQLSIYNRALIERATREGGLPATRKVTQRWAKESGAWSIGLGYPMPDLTPGRWPGHLVLIVERHWLWDLSIDQANRPQHGIEFHQPVLLPVTEAFLRGRERLVEWWEENCLLMYDAKPEDKSFRASSAWELEVELAYGSPADPIRRILQNMEDEHR